MSVQEATLDTPLVYPLENRSNFDQNNKLRDIQQRIQERQKKLKAMDSNHEVIYQMVNDILGDSNIEQISRSEDDLTQKLQTTRLRIQNRKDKLLYIEQEHDKVLKIADDALLQAEKEIQNAKRIEQEQKDIQQQMLIVRHDLKAACGKAALIKREQIEISQNIEFMEKILREAFSNVTWLLPRLDKVFLVMSKVKFNHEQIDKRFEDLHKQSQIIKIDQTKRGIKLDVLNQSHSSLLSDATDWMNAKVFTNPIETLHDVKFMTSYLWTNLTPIASTTISWIAWAALEVYKLEEKILPTLMQWSWAYVSSNVSPITWIALGIFASLFAKSLISNYPLISLVVFGYSFIIYINYDYLKSLIWQTSG